MTEHANGTPQPPAWYPPPLLMRGAPWILATFAGRFSAIVGLTFSENLIPSQFVIADALLRSDAARGLANNQPRLELVHKMGADVAGVAEAIAPDEWSEVREGQPWLLVVFGGFGAAIGVPWYASEIIPEQVAIAAKVCGLEGDRLLRDMKAAQDDAAPLVVPAHRLPH